MRNYFETDVKVQTPESYVFRVLTNAASVKADDGGLVQGVPDSTFRGNPEIEDVSALVDEAEDRARQIILQAEQEAERIIAEAEKASEDVRNNAHELGHKAGYDKGFAEGVRTAKEEQEELMRSERENLLQAVKAAVANIEQMKQDIIDKHYRDLRNLAITIAEKVVGVSLKSSGEIIEQMILAATEQMRNREWANIHISEHDADLVLESDVDILESLKGISDQVKVVVKENEPSGTCIIEFPDQIIDASVETQFENVRSILGVSEE